MSTIDETVPADLPQLIDIIATQPGFPDIVDALQAGNSAAIDGIWGSSCALTVTALVQRLQRPLCLCVRHSIRDAEEFAEELASVSSLAVQLFPAWTGIPEEDSAADPVAAGRLKVLRAIDSGETAPDVIVACLPALMQPVPDRQTLEGSIRSIRSGQEIDLNEVSEWLMAQGFERVTAVELPGEFAIHGGILDLFPATERDPIRVELFGDEIESIRSFDAETQRRLAELNQVDLLTPRTESSSRNSGFASFSASLLDYLPEQSFTTISDLQHVVSEGRLYSQRMSDPRGLFSADSAMARLTAIPSVTIDALGVDSYETSCHISMEPLERFSGNRRDALLELSLLLGSTDRALLCCHSDGELKRLRELISETDSAHQTTLKNSVSLTVGGLRKGFRLPDRKLVVLSDSELLSRTPVRRTARQRTADSRAIDSFLDLREGSLVVHVSHGIARYRGMKMVHSEGVQEEHLLLEFRDEVIVYVPVSLIHLVQKYVGPAKTTPELTKYGGNSWQKKKDQVSSAVSDMASDMLKLQAERNSRPGLISQADGQLQEEFETAFPWQETPDQDTAIRELKNDMESPLPMDRLICGDVGFGKTEVAMRAAFKAVDNGRQVAVLVPTTVLAEQHFRTFSQRMSEFPVTVEMLSRFRTDAEQRAILEKAAAGEVDVLIGTHRLVSKDVHFRDLGLLVIDEEQKFGVRVKERLKTMRAEVDVLTLTATPIPRTLHLSLLGIRDISSLTTPPRERVPIETRVCRFDEKLIRSAMLRELNRGGQIYFVHNRVHDIEKIAIRLRQIVPEATVTIAHGQMQEHELERAMVDFVNGRADILLATTIIESGLDIPNANTMFIHQADIYGLSDLHQLRGRVGRDRHRAYCYLLLEEGRVVTTKATRRLKAIEEYSELGAGFRIAMRDLEIRGAGNILGTEQSGNIAAVGYELYCQLLENAVRSLKKQPLRYQPHCRIDLPVPCFIPDRYVPDQKLKIEVYRRLSQCNTVARVEELMTELRDRFGPVPAAARLLLNLRELSIRAISWKIDVIRLEDGFAALRYRDAKLIGILSHLHRGHLRVVDQHEAYWPLESAEDDGGSVLQELLEALRIADPGQDQDSAAETS